MIIALKKNNLYGGLLHISISRPYLMLISRKYSHTRSRSSIKCFSLSISIMGSLSGERIRKSFVSFLSHRIISKSSIFFGSESSHILLSLIKNKGKI